MNLMELDIALKFCEKKIDSMLVSKKFHLDSKSDEFKKIAYEREIWVKRKNNIESKIEEIVIKKL